MKIRNGFVSNSSSSSFVINLKDLSAYQLDQIKNHISEGKLLGMECCNSDDEWWVHTHDNVVEGSTIMDNFDMYDFLQKIGIDMSKVRWEN